MKITTKGPGDFNPPEPDASCDGCGLDDCPECAECSRGHDAKYREDGKCQVWIECRCGVVTCDAVDPGETCPGCGENYQEETQ
jgi:hypothetical protein